MMLSERAQRLGHPSALGSPSACMSWFITTHLPLQGTSHSLKAIGQQTCWMTLCQDCRTLCQSPLYMHLMMLSERAQRLGHPSALGSPGSCMSWFIPTHLPLQGTSHSLKAIGQQTCCMTLCQDCRTLCQSPLYMHLMMLSERAQRLGHPSALGSPGSCMSWFITTHLPLQGTSHSLKAIGQQTCCMTLCQDCRTLCQSPLYMHLWWCCQKGRRDWVILAPRVLQVLACLDSSQHICHYRAHLTHSKQLGNKHAAWRFVRIAELSVNLHYTCIWWCCQKGRRDWVILAPWVLQVLACLDSSQHICH